MTFECVVNEVETLRKLAPCSNAWENDGIAGYTFMPSDTNNGYMVEYDLTTGKSRNCGLSCGCFWTPWE